MMLIEEWHSPFIIIFIVEGQQYIFIMMFMLSCIILILCEVIILIILQNISPFIDSDLIGENLLLLPVLFMFIEKDLIIPDELVEEPNIDEEDIMFDLVDIIIMLFMHSIILHIIDLWGILIIMLIIWFIIQCMFISLCIIFK